MSSRVRILLKIYPAKVHGYNAYRGADALKFIEDFSLLKLKRPIALKQLGNVFAVLCNRSPKLGFLPEITVWRIRRRAPKTAYETGLRKARCLMVWDKELSTWVSKAVKRPASSFQYKVKFGAPAGVRPRIRLEDFEVEIAEPRDR